MRTLAIIICAGLFVINTAFNIFPYCVSGWDCVDRALFQYKAAGLIGIELPIKYSSSARHVWVSPLDGINIKEWRYATLDELEQWAADDN